MNKNNSVLIAIDAVGIRGHGGAVVLSDLLQWLPRVRPDWRWHVFLLEPDLRQFEDPPVAGQVTIQNTRSGNHALARLIWVRGELQEKLKSLNADLVLSFANIGSPRPCRPQVLFCHQPHAFSTKSIPIGPFRKLRVRIIRRQILIGAAVSHAVIVQTEAMQRNILALNPALRSKIHVIPSGCMPPSDKPTIRKEKKTLIDNAGSPKLIYVSLPRMHKNHSVLIEALPAILKAFPSASLLLTDGLPDPHNLSLGQVLSGLRKRDSQFGSRLQRGMARLVDT